MMFFCKNIIFYLLSVGVCHITVFLCRCVITVNSRVLYVVILQNTVCCFCNYPNTMMSGPAVSDFRCEEMRLAHECT